MADYTDLAALKTLILEQANKIKGLAVPFVSGEATEAYNTAKQECGFPFPVPTDEDNDRKCFWIKERMRRWFIATLWDQYTFRFDTSDMKSSQLVKNLMDRVVKLDEDFQKAKEDPALAALFIEASDIFGTKPLVIGTGFEDDRLGQGIESRT